MDGSAAELSSFSDTHFECKDKWETSDSTFSSPKIFGRQADVQLLLKTFHRVAATKQSATILVHGESGSGKTSLVETLRIPVVKNGGYFCAGKFFQNSALQEPYSAIMAAFSDVCDVVTQAHDFNNERQRKIRQALGTDGHLLRTVISSISVFLDDDTPEFVDGWCEILNERSFAKFKGACKTFLQAVSSDDHPIVLFIDDIQWMDVGSRQLIELFLRDTEMKNFLLILAYREEEAAKLSNLFHGNHHTVDIPLKRLDVSDIYEIICATTKSQSEQFRELSVLTESRSNGNPFHVQEFLAMIQMEGLLAYDDETDTWIFDVDDIRSSVMLRTSLADLLTRKIEHAQRNVRETLKVASLIGYHFEESVLLACTSFVLTGIYEPSDAILTSITESLKEAVRIGFIEHIKGGFQFTHDKIQTSFQEIIGSREVIKRIHHIIGRSILLLGNDDDATMYQAVVHFNAAKAKSSLAEAETYHLVQMNYRGALHCVSKSAFEAASSLLQYGLDAMNYSQRWSDRFFSLSFAMTELLARAELVIGHFDGCKKSICEALLHAKTTEMKIKSLLLDLEVRMVNNELNEFVPSANRALLALKVKMPQRVTRRHIAVKFLHVKLMMRKKTDDKILSLPNLDNYFISTAIIVLTKICTQCLFRDDEDQAVYAALKAFELTIKFGLSQNSPMAFVVYGVVEMTLGNFDEGYRFGKLALKLLEIVGGDDSVARTVGVALTLLTYRREQFSGLKNELLRAGNIGLKNGDIMPASYCISQAIILDGLLGTNLYHLEDSIKFAMHQISELGQDFMLSWFKPILQWVLNLQSHLDSWQSIIILSGEAMQEDDFIRAAQQAKHPILVVITLIHKCGLACFFGYFEDASNTCRQVETLGKAARMSYGQIPFIYYAALSNYELYRVSRKRRELTRARHYTKALKDLLSQGCLEVGPWHELLLTVSMTLKKCVTHDELIKSYHESISKIAHKGASHLEGLMNEHAGFEMERRGYSYEAIVYFKRALYIYKNQWCSNAKYQWLLQRLEKYENQMQSSSSLLIGDFVVCDS